MDRPPLLFLYPSLRRSATRSLLLFPLRPRHSPTRRSPPLLRPHPHHHLPIRRLTTTTHCPTSPPSSLFSKLRRLTPSIPTLTLLTLTYLLYSVSPTFMPVTGASMSPLLNPPSPLSARSREDWVWVETWPGRLIRFDDDALNPASSYDDDDDGEEKGKGEVIKGGVPWRKLKNPIPDSGKRKYSGPRGLIKRGLVVALYSPSSPGGEEGKLLVKRIVALPGDVVTPRPGSKYPRTRVVVPEGSVWVEGDNELGERSWDSNFFGPVGVGMLVGRVGGRVWPWGRWGALEEGEGDGDGEGKGRVVQGGGRRVRLWSGGGGGDGDWREGEGG